MIFIKIPCQSVEGCAHSSDSDSFNFSLERRAPLAVNVGIVVIM